MVNLYLAKGHRPAHGESEFLTAIANAMAGVIARKQMDEALEREKELETKTSNLEGRNGGPQTVISIDL